MMLARNDYGNVITLPGIHPRKELLARCGRKHATKVYMTKNNGQNVHVGYVVAGRWWELFVTWEKKENDMKNRSHFVWTQVHYENPVRIIWIGHSRIVQNEGGDILSPEGTFSQCLSWCHKNGCYPIRSSWQKYNKSGK